MKDFLPIPEYPEYLISKTGRVYSTKSDRLLKPFRNTAGYWQIVFSYGNKQYKPLLHRLLARVYKDLPSLDSELEVDHNDSDKDNLNLDNLVVRTRKDHLNKTLLDRGHKSSGFCSCGAKLSSYRIKECKKCFHKRTMQHQEITAKSIEYWVCNFSWVRAAKELGLSDNGLRKRYKSLTGKDPKQIKRV